MSIFISRQFYIIVYFATILITAIFFLSDSLINSIYQSSKITFDKKTKISEWENRILLIYYIIFFIYNVIYMLFLIAAKSYAFKCHMLILVISTLILISSFKLLTYIIDNSSHFKVIIGNVFCILAAISILVIFLSLLFIFIEHPTINSPKRELLQTIELDELNNSSLSDDISSQCYIGLSQETEYVYIPKGSNSVIIGKNISKIHPNSDGFPRVEIYSITKEYISFWSNTKKIENVSEEYEIYIPNDTIVLINTQ